MKVPPAKIATAKAVLQKTAHLSTKNLHDIFMGWATFAFEGKFLAAALIALGIVLIFAGLAVMNLEGPGD